FVLLAKFLLAVSPAAGRDAGRDARLDARRVHRDCRAEALTVDRDAVFLHLVSRLEEFQRMPCVLDLLETDRAAALAFALAAAAHVEAQDDIAERGEELRCRGGHAAVLVAAEAVQHHERGPAFALLQILGDVQDAGELESVARKLDAL